MDIQKLIAISEDIKEDEKRFNIQWEINQLLTFLNASQIDDLEEKRKELIETIKETTIYWYWISNLKILKRISWADYFGVYLIERILIIFSSSWYSTSSELQKFISERKIFISSMESLHDIVGELGITNDIDISTASIWLLLPDNIDSLSGLNTQIVDFDTLIRTIVDITWWSASEVKISHVNNGCVELFIDVWTMFVVGKFTKDLISTVIWWYKEYQEILIKNEELKSLKIDNATKQMGAISKQFKLLEEQKYKELLDGKLPELIKKYKEHIPKEQSQNELKIRLKRNVRTFIKSLNKWVKIEVLPPTHSVDSEDDKIGEWEKEFKKELIDLNHEILPLEFDGLAWILDFVESDEESDKNKKDK